jgi:ubiquinone/menaquinone biosynthesis C-methylase UbiE
VTKTKRGYQFHLSKEHDILKDVGSRTQKFRKIMGVLKDFRQGLAPAICLDIGCSSGVITSLLGQHFSMAIGINIDRDALRHTKTHAPPPRAHFLIADSMALPFKNNSIDVIVCNHIYEHVPAAKRMMEEIHRVLKENGFCYFSAGNKYMIIEGHYHLPFLSWVPKTIAHQYLKIARKGEYYYEEHLSLRGLKQLVRKFRIHDYTLSIIRNPEEFFATDIFNTHKFLYKYIRWIAPYLYQWIPTYIWILTKK